MYDVALPLTTIATAQSKMTIVKMARRFTLSARTPIGKVASAPTNDTIAISSPIWMLLIPNAFSSWPDTAEIVPLSAASSPRTDARIRIIGSRPGPPTALSIQALAVPAIFLAVEATSNAMAMLR